MNDPVLAALVERLSSERGCHTILLYGSQARGDAGPESDYDVVGFSGEASSLVRIAERWQGALLDVWVYPSARLGSPDAHALHMRGGVVLTDRDGAGARFLAGLEELHAKGPAPTPPDELAANRVWAWKTLARAAQNDIEAHYRRAQLLTVLLEYYFVFRGAWFPGSKQAFAALAAEAPETFSLFEAAFAPDAPLTAIETLVTHLCGPRAI